MAAIRFDSTSWLAGAVLFGVGSFGVVGSQVPSTGTAGAGYLYNDLTLPADAAKEVCGRILTVPSGGTLIAEETSAFTYTGPTGTATYALYVDGVLTGNPGTIALTMGAANVAPTGGPDSASPAYQTPVTINVLANDSDSDGTINAASVQIVTQGTKGTAVANSNGTITYTPNAGATGADSFTYRVADNTGAFSSPITVTIAIGGAPVVVNQAPIAVGNSLSVAYGTAGTINVLANDSDPDGTLNTGSVQIVTQPTKGTITGTTGGNVTYMPNTGATGADSFTYRVADNLGLYSSPATVTVTIAAAPVTPSLTGSLTMGPFVSPLNAPITNAAVYWTFLPTWRAGNALPISAVSGVGTINGSGNLVIATGLPTATWGELLVGKRNDSNPANDEVFSDYLLTSG